MNQAQAHAISDTAHGHSTTDTARSSPSPSRCGHRDHGEAVKREVQHEAQPHRARRWPDQRKGREHREVKQQAREPEQREEVDLADPTASND